MARTHDTKWRLLVGAAPALGVAFIVCAAAQGEPDVARSPVVQAILAGVAALGALVAGWTARQLRAAPSLTIADAGVLAQAGQGARVVTLRGSARPLPGAAPLTSPEGRPCLWFWHGAHYDHHFHAHDSVRPFLLVDDTGSCIVLPAGADITGSSRSGPPPAQRKLAIDGSPGLGGSERLMCDGDRLLVVGRFVPVSAEATALQDQAALLTHDTERPATTVRATDPDAFRRAVAAARPAPPSPLAPLQPALALPVVCEGATGELFVVSIGHQEGEDGPYRLLAWVDVVVMIVAGGFWAWAQWAGR